MKINLARTSQIFFFITFIILFILTDYRGKDEISLAINSFFRSDPLVVISYLISTMSFNFLLLPGVILIIATIFLGRFFCGWICPLGSFLDFLSKKIPKKGTLKHFNYKFKYYLLFSLLFLALFDINYAGIFDPLAIFIRFLTFLFYPLFGYVIKSSWSFLYNIFGSKIEVAEGFYRFIKYNLLPFRETFYPLAFLSTLIFFMIFFLERFEKRFWCKHLCPLGCLLTVLGRFSIFKRIPNRLCPDCKECKDICPTSFDSDVLNTQNCIMCMDCYAKCKLKRISFHLKSPKFSILNFDFDRRVLMSSFLSGFVLSKIFKDENYSGRLLRPPGVRDENEFLKKCVRCGECMKICLKNALYPDFKESGIYGLYTPILIPRKGYCEYNCTLCGQVCPTKAIPELSLEEKRKQIIGKAHFDKNHCLPYAKKKNCLVCEEHCPVPDKAIKVRKKMDLYYNNKTIELLEPYVDDKLCIGCGICEYVCPLPGKAGIEIFRENIIN